MHINKDNVQKIIDHIKMMPEKAFYMGAWLTTEEETPLSALYGCIRDNPDAAKALLEKQEAAKTDEHPCGTAACIAGYAAIIAISSRDPLVDKFRARAATSLFDSKKEIKTTDYVDIEPLAAAWLGFEPDDEDRSETDHAGNLFAGPSNLGKVTKEQAIAVLEHLRDTGEVNWKRVGVRSDFEVEKDDDI